MDFIAAEREEGKKERESVDAKSEKKNRSAVKACTTRIMKIDLKDVNRDFLWETMMVDNNDTFNVYIPDFIDFFLPPTSFLFLLLCQRSGLDGNLSGIRLPLTLTLQRCGVNRRTNG